MMSATSRRTFLSGAAAVAAGVACLNAAPADVARTRQSEPVDESAVDDFFSWPRHEEPENQDRARLAWMLLGLICTDVDEEEALLPNADGIEHVKTHTARLWVRTEWIDGALPADVETGKTSDGGLTYFSIAKRRVQVAAVDKDGKVVTFNAPDLKWRNSRQQPWRDKRYLRSLEAHTGQRIIGDKLRDDTSRVISRVELKGGRVAAMPPFLRQGQYAEWRSERNGKVTVGATTDSVLWTRRVSNDADRLRVTFVMGDKKPELFVKGAGKRFLAAITHTTDEEHDNVRELMDSIAFARLLDKNDPKLFPVPKLIGEPVPPIVGTGGDVHCEGGTP